MTELARRTIQELVARYELEPSLDDVYVEGTFDREVIASTFGTDTKGRAIYEIETVDIPLAILASHGLTSGNKQRVIALARELAKIRSKCAYVCLVDKDLDHWFGRLEAIDRLKWCPYCSIELHFFSIPILNDLLVITCNARIPSIDLLVHSMSGVLTELYLMRLADRYLSCDLRWIPFVSYLSSNETIVSLAADKYINSLLQSNGKFSHKTRFLKAIEKFRPSVIGECRSHIRGHDFVELLAWSIRRFRGVRELASVMAVQRLFILTARSSPNIRQEIRATL